MRKTQVLVSLVLVISGIALQVFSHWNRYIFSQINNFHFPCLDTIMVPITYCGDGVIHFLVALGFWRLRGWKKFLRLILVLVTIGFLVQAIKRIFPLARPSQVFSQIHVLGPTLKAYTFPSGHTASTFGLVGFLTPEFPKLRTIAWLIAILIAYSRVYVGAHFPADVLFGAGLGCLVTMIYMSFGKKVPAPD